MNEPTRSRPRHRQGGRPDSASHNRRPLPPQPYRTGVEVDGEQPRRSRRKSCQQISSQVPFATGWRGARSTNHGSKRIGLRHRSRVGRCRQPALTIDQSQSSAASSNGHYSFASNLTSMTSHLFSMISMNSMSRLTLGGGGRMSVGHKSPLALVG